ncbi:MAG: TonB-dependent receptor, partial [Lacipirellulaceae bacterium]
QLMRLEDQEQISQEIRYASTFSDSYWFTVGAYSFDQSWDFTEQRNEIVNVNTKAKLDHTSMALFADLDYDLSDALVLNLGGRFTKEEKTAATAAFGPPLAPGAVLTPGFCDPDADIVMNCIFGPDESKEWTNFSPKLSLSYRLNRDSLIYGILTRGFRSGGFAMRGAPLAPAYDEEIVDAFELGYKADLFEKRLRVNGAFFYNKYDDLQRTVVDPVTILQTTLNAAQATIVGLELEVVAMLSDDLVLNFNYGHTDASYDAFDNFDIDGDGIVDPEAVDLDFARVPENQYSVALTHEKDVDGLGTLMSRISYSYTDERALDDNNFINVSSYEDLSASIRLMDAKGRWSVALFGKNLTDEEVFTWGLNVLGGLAWGGAPRTWGVELAYEY